MEYERFSQSVRQLLDSERQAREKSTRIMKLLPAATGIEPKHSGPGRSA
jgi:hypothetical protein